MTQHTHCPHCNTQLTKTQNTEYYACRQCGRKLRQTVVENLETFESLAERDSPAAKIAEAILEGQGGQYDTHH